MYIRYRDQGLVTLIIIFSDQRGICCGERSGTHGDVCNERRTDLCHQGHWAQVNVSLFIYLYPTLVLFSCERFGFSVCLMIVKFLAPIDHDGFIVEL